MDNNIKYIIGAYATAPSTVIWDKDLESEYYQQLNAFDNIEHPFVGKLHGYSHHDDWFLASINTQ